METVGPPIKLKMYFGHGPRQNQRNSGFLEQKLKKIELTYVVLTIFN